MILAASSERANCELRTTKERAVATVALYADRTNKKKFIEFFRHSFPYSDSTFSRLYDKMEGTIVGNVTIDDFRNIQISSECFFSYVLISHDHTAFVNISTT